MSNPGEVEGLHSRRAFVKLVGQATLVGATVPIFGCGASGKSPDLTAAKTPTQHLGNGMAVVGGALAVIPTFQSKTVAAIISVIGASLTAASDLIPEPPKDFDPGAIVKRELAKVKKLAPADIADDLIEQIAKAFEQKGVGKTFKTPIVEAKGKESFILQAHTDHHSLVRGADDSAYEVRNVWVDWLIEKDACDLRVIGDTMRQKCESCEEHAYSLHVIRQCFQYRDGDTVDLLYVDEDHPDLEALNFHLSHTKAFVPCRGGGAPHEDYRVEVPPNDESVVPEPNPNPNPNPDSNADEDPNVPAFTPGLDSTTGSDGGYEYEKGDEGGSDAED